MHDMIVNSSEGGVWSVAPTALGSMRFRVINNTAVSAQDLAHSMIAREPGRPAPTPARVVRTRAQGARSCTLSNRPRPARVRSRPGALPNADRCCVVWWWQGCCTPRLIIFEEAAPNTLPWGLEWAPLPPEWHTDNMIQLSVSRGTLVPAADRKKPACCPRDLAAAGQMVAAGAAVYANLHSLQQQGAYPALQQQPGAASYPQQAPPNAQYAPAAHAHQPPGSQSQQIVAIQPGAQPPQYVYSSSPLVQLSCVAGTAQRAETSAQGPAVQAGGPPGVPPGQVPQGAVPAQPSDGTITYVPMVMQNGQQMAVLPGGQTVPVQTAPDSQNGTQQITVVTSQPGPASIPRPAHTMPPQVPQVLHVTAQEGPAADADAAGHKRPRPNDAAPDANDAAAHVVMVVPQAGMPHATPAPYFLGNGEPANPAPADGTATATQAPYASSAVAVVDSVATVPTASDGEVAQAEPAAHFMDDFRAFMSTPAMKDPNVAHSQIQRATKGGEPSTTDGGLAMNLRWTIMHQMGALLEVNDSGFLDSLRLQLQAYLDQTSVRTHPTAEAAAPTN